MVLSIGSITPSGAARTMGSLVLVQRIAHSLLSWPIRRRLEAMRSTFASPVVTWVQGCGSAIAAAAAFAAAARARSAQSPAMITAQGLQPAANLPRRRIPARAQRMADRRRGVGRERAQPDHPHTSRSTRR